MRKEDAQLADKLVHKELNVLGKDLDFNIVDVDVPSVTGSFDLLGYFRKPVHNCSGRFWAEQKVCSVATYDKVVREQKEELPERFVREKRKDSSLCGVLLVCAKVGKSGKEWAEPTVTVFLWRAETQTWQKPLLSRTGYGSNCQIILLACSPNCGVGFPTLSRIICMLQKSR